MSSSIESFSERKPQLQSDLTFTFESGDITEEQFIVNNWFGKLKEVIVAPGASSGAVVTTAVTVKDKDDRSLVSDSGLAEGSENTYLMDRMIWNQIKVGITPEVDPINGQTVIVHLKGE